MTGLEKYAKDAAKRIIRRPDFTKLAIDLENPFFEVNLLMEVCDSLDMSLSMEDWGQKSRAPCSRETTEVMLSWL